MGGRRCNPDGLLCELDPHFPLTAGVCTHRRTWFAASSTGARRTDGAGHAVGAIFARGADGAGGTLGESPEAGGQVVARRQGRCWGAISSCHWRARQETRGGGRGQRCLLFLSSPPTPWAGLTLGPEGPAGPAAPWSPEGP